LLAAGWRENIQQLGLASAIDIVDYASFIRSLEQRRAFFKSLGATASDCGVASPACEWLAPTVVEAIFQRALKGQTDASDAQRFTAHMLMEMARMSAEDGLVMQIHAGILRNHNPAVFARFGPDKGFDIPIRCEFTHNLQPLLAEFGSHPNFSLILFTLDETAYARELAPLAGAYPSVKLGPPWWFHDSWNGIRRYFDQVMETAGVYNTAGFNDDTRAFLSIPARHDVWRRAAANWLAGLVRRGMIDRSDAETIVVDLAYGLAKKAYRLD
jgi:glucuronate isomerase